jgi:hypothetical protein
MTPALPPNFIALGMAVGVLASVVGFFACAVLWAHTRRLRRHAPAILIDHAALYSWGAVFFGGIALLLVQLLMGKYAIIPMPPTEALPLVVTTPVQLWALVCVAGMAAAKAYRVQQRFRWLKHNPQQADRRGFPKTALALFMVIATLGFIGSAACGPNGPLATRTQPEMAGEAQTYLAVAPQYLQFLKTSKLDATQKAMYVRTVQTWYDRLAVELQGDPTYGQGQLQPDDAAIYKLAGIPAPLNITTQPAAAQ